MRVASETLRVQLYLKNRLISTVSIIEPQLTDLITVPLESSNTITDAIPVQLSKFMMGSFSHQDAIAGLVSSPLVSNKRGSSSYATQEKAPTETAMAQGTSTDQITPSLTPAREATSAAPSNVPSEISPLSHETSSNPLIGSIPTPVSIHDHCISCMNQYQSLSSTLKETTATVAIHVGFDAKTSLRIVEDAHVRFKAWATNIAATQQPRLPSSLDSQLKDAADIRQRILKILADLEVSLQTGEFYEPTIAKLLTD
jgi:hypothetical protein